MRRNYLFSKVDWHSVQENQKQTMSAEISNLDSNRLLNSSVADLCDYFEEKFSIVVPVLIEDQIVADQHEAKIDVSQDRMRHISDRSRPFYIDGTEIEIMVPFEGEAEVFKIQPTTFTLSPPVADIGENKLFITITGIDLKPEEVRSKIDRTISEIKSSLTHLQNSAAGLNGQLRGLAETQINRRKEKLLADQDLVSALGFPLKQRPDAPTTYVAPEVKRKITPVLPPASSEPYTPEPILSDDDYDHILSVMENMAHVMERSPSAFKTMDEEALRSHFLVQLNGHYEGQATGETFNYHGKTDILIRVDDKNIFIGECKYWGGPKMLTDTIDQLLGYSSWRDTKVAVIIFNRRKNFTAVLDSIAGVVESHENYKQTIGKNGETNFKYIFSHKDDPQREMILSIMAFDVPT
jgi:hypothetical protein